MQHKMKQFRFRPEGACDNMHVYYGVVMHNYTTDAREITIRDLMAKDPEADKLVVTIDRSLYVRIANVAGTIGNITVGCVGNPGLNNWVFNVYGGDTFITNVVYNSRGWEDLLDAEIEVAKYLWGNHRLDQSAPLSHVEVSTPEAVNS